MHMNGRRTVSAPQILRRELCSTVVYPRILVLVGGPQTI